MPSAPNRRRRDAAPPVPPPAPPRPPRKVAVCLRIDPDVLAHFRSEGRGWQTRMHDVLKEKAGLDQRDGPRDQAIEHVKTITRFLNDRQIAAVAAWFAAEAAERGVAVAIGSNQPQVSRQSRGSALPAPLNPIATNFPIPPISAASAGVKEARRGNRH